jgi:ankyrin repeat protein
MKAHFWVQVAAACAMAMNGHTQTLSDRFYQAIRNNDLASLKNLLATADVNVRDQRGATPLMYTAAFGNVEQLKLLLESGADVNAANAFKSTALIWAGGDPVKSRLLIDHGADINIRNQQGRMPLIVAAGYDAGPELVRLLLARGAEARASDTGGRALLLAAARGDVETMKLLIDAGADVNAVSPLLGETPLLNAAVSDNVAAVELLVAKGADVNGVIRTGRTAVRGGAAVEMAISNMTALMWAAPWGTPEMIGALLKAGADVNTRDKRGMTALMLAVASETQDAGVVRLLLKAGADVNLRSVDGEMALDWARKFGSPAVIRILQEAGAKGTAPQPTASAPNDHATRDIAKAVETSTSLLQRSSSEFFKQSGCVGCHHQDMTALAIHAARKAGMPVDEAAAREQLQVMESLAGSMRELHLLGLRPATAADLEGLWVSGHSPDMTTDSMVAWLASSQRLDGHWHKFAGLARSPMGDGPISITAQALLALRHYKIPARRAEFDDRIARARAWLLRAEPRFTEEAAWRLLALSSAGAPPEQIRKVADSLMAQQRSDGGWAGNPNLASDAFSTARALYALRETALLDAANRGHRRGVQYLLRTQYPDGSWHVRSRAVKFQPYFQSGFPFEHDQWISAAATAWATTALAAQVEHDRRVARQ